MYEQKFINSLLTRGLNYKNCKFGTQVVGRNLHFCWEYLDWKNIIKELIKDVRNRETCENRESNKLKIYDNLHLSYYIL